MERTGAERFIGIDVAKAHLDVAVLPSDQVFRVTNDPDGWTTLRQRLLADAVTSCVVVEATGHYHVGVGCGGHVRRGDQSRPHACVRPQ